MSDAVKRHGNGGLVIVSITVLVSVIILVALGTWQLKRLTWKENMIATIAERQSAPAISMQKALDEFAKGTLADITRVNVQGTYEHGRELHLYTALEGRPGWRVITPLVMKEGKIVFVDRGFVPEELKSFEQRKAGLPTGDVTVTGNVRLHNEGKATFVPENEPAENKWFWYDLKSMQEVASNQNEQSALPFFVQLEDKDHDGSWPQAVKVSLKISNSHLGYALTWFALALVLLVIYAVFVVGRRKGNKQ